jgi:hypothetical protein
MEISKMPGREVGERVAVSGAAVEPVGSHADADGGLVMVEVTMTGRSPLLMNPMAGDDLLKLWDKSGKKAKNAERPTLREAAESRLYRTNDGWLYVPSKCLMACLIGAGQYIRLDGKRQVSTAKSSTLPGILSIHDHYLRLYKPGTDETPTWEVDVQQGRNPNGGEAVALVRPRIDEWEMRTTIEADVSQLSMRLIRELFDIAGKRMGLLDFRPQKKGTYGQFNINRWAVVSGGKVGAAA